MQNESHIVEKPILQMRAEVISFLRATLPGANLYDLARREGITIARAGKINKGWVGQTIEKVAELTAGNRQQRDGIDFELKTTSVVPEGSGWKPKETIKITQLTPKAMLQETFETSAVWDKLSRFILVGCHHESETHCRVVSVNSVDLVGGPAFEGVKTFWEEIQRTLLEGELADFPYPGTFQDFIQLRPTGTGKHSSTCPITGRKFPAMAFYGTKRLIENVLSV